MLLHYLEKVRSSNLWYFTKLNSVLYEEKQSKNCVTFDKNWNVSLHTAECFTIVAWSICLLLAHLRKDAHATLHLHCQWWSGQCHAKHAANAASVHHCCAPASDRLPSGWCPISNRFSRHGRGQDCSVATDPMEWKQALPAREVVQCQICALSLVYYFFGTQCRRN